MLKMDEKLYRQASRIENKHPEKALKIYRKLERDNLEMRRDVLLIGTIFPLIGFLAAFFIIQSLAYQADVVRVVIWCVVGFTPVVLYSLIRKNPAKWSSRGYIFTTRDMFIYPLIAFCQLFLMCLLAAILAFVLLLIMSFNVGFDGLLTVGFWWFPSFPPWGDDTPYFILWPILIVSFIFSFIYLSTEIPLARIFSIRSILLAVKSNFKAILFWILPILLALILVGGFTGFFYDNFTHGAILSLIMGITFGFILAPVEREKFIAELYRIAKIRCLMRMHRNFEAEFLLTTKKDVMRGKVDASNRTIWYLTCALLHTVKKTQREDALECINKAFSSLPDNEYRETLSDSIRKTRNFILKYDFNTGEEAETSGSLCYILGWISGLASILLKRNDKFIRFHAVQSTIAFGILTIVYFIIVFTDWIPFLASVWINWLVLVITVILWIQLMAKAGRGTPYKLPWLGNLVEKWVG